MWRAFVIGIIVLLVGAVVALSDTTYYNDQIGLNLTYNYSKPQQVSDQILSNIMYRYGRPATVRDYLNISPYGVLNNQGIKYITLAGISYGHGSVQVTNNTLYPCNPALEYLVINEPENVSLAVYYNGSLIYKGAAAGPDAIPLSFVAAFNRTMIVDINGTPHLFTLNALTRTALIDPKWKFNGFSAEFTAKVVVLGTNLPAPCEKIIISRNGTVVQTVRPQSTGNVDVIVDIPPGVWEVCAKPEHANISYCKEFSNIVTVTVSVPSFGVSSPGIGSPQGLYIALVSAVIYLYFATRWGNPFLALIPFGLIIYGYGVITRSYFLSILGGAALIAGALINYLQGKR